MIAEVWIQKLLPGAEAEWRRRTEIWLQIMKRLNVTFRFFRPETGCHLDRFVGVYEFESLTAREAFWANLPEEGKALLRKSHELWDSSANEHYYYREVKVGP